ncbi:OmpH family outer membrane protein [Tenacibaculum sp.]|uniref:OmpH family outer membrane protein n=1 Tax=Tenacibaculum sp. TaxID=1906242 RepID=UPI003D09B66B
MKSKYIWSAINSLLIVGLLIWSVFLMQNKKKTIVFIDNVRVFKEFNMTKELGRINEEKYKPELVAYDSLVKAMSIVESDLKNKNSKVDKKETEKYLDLKRRVSNKEKELEEIRIYVKNEINKKVWTRLNAYVKDYGEENNFDLIIGAQGSGNIMYGNSTIDYTDEFINYANFKYEGN